MAEKRLGADQEALFANWLGASVRPTLVVNLRDKPAEGFVYVGRKMAGRGASTTGPTDGRWGNPFGGKGGKDVVEGRTSFVEWFLAKVTPGSGIYDEGYRRRLLELRGKTLACWCFPGPCHASVIAAWLDGDEDLLEATRQGMAGEIDHSQDVGQLLFSGTSTRRVIGIPQPWAGLVVRGICPVINRTWYPTLAMCEGHEELAIHATKPTDPGDFELAIHVHASWEDSVPQPRPLNEVEDAIIGSVKLLAFVDQEDLDDPELTNVAAWAKRGPKDVAWLVTDPVEFLQPIRTPGRPGLWKLPPALAGAYQLRQRG